MKSQEYIEKAKEIKNISSYKLSNITGIAQSTLSQYKNGKRTMDDYACFKIAEILCIDPKKIIARANAEREKDEEKKEFWLDRVKEYGFITLKMQLAIMGAMSMTTLAYLIVINSYFIQWIVKQSILCKIDYLLIIWILFPRSIFKSKINHSNNKNKFSA